ncbi:MAG: fibronectin type III domain-containing protein [Acidimicrobiia bacterium]|nr:fibronectin type III domain-containing protein [Acidimicrobiia bacterium]
MTMSPEGEISGTIAAGAFAGSPYVVSVVVFDRAAGGQDPLSDSTTFTWTISDNTPPLFVGNVVASAPATATDTTMNLSWPVATDTGSGLFEYRVTGGPAPLMFPAGTNAALITGLSPSTPYTFQVVAVDNAGNVSPALTSNTLSTTP